MAAEFHNDKLNIKALLFTKALPNYKIPVPTHGHKLFSCIDCGDRYIMESSYDYHIKRKSVKITYNCRHCGEVKFFYNRCNLLCHIRSHAFKTATINVSDLKVEPLPIDLIPFYKPQKLSKNSTCYECKMDTTMTGTAYKDRAKHYMQLTNKVFSCPICMFTLPTPCALKAHLRVHLKNPPFYCPECGIHLHNKSIQYPYGHDCEGFKMMRATARLNCLTEESHIFHPNDYNQHMKTLHFKKVYKCPVCVVACFNEESIQCHLKSHNYDLKAIVFYQCEKCSGKLVLQNQVDSHLKSHTNSFVYPCWTCGSIFKQATTLISHHVENHTQELNISKQLYATVLNDLGSKQNQKKDVYQVVKRCIQCKCSFTYKCKHNDINSLPVECPNKCSIGPSISQNEAKTNLQIKCHLCKNKISQNWEEVKKHYSIYHKTYKCIDVSIVLPKLDKNKIKAKGKHRHKNLRKRLNKRVEGDEKVIKEKSIVNKCTNVASAITQSQFKCYKCGLENEDKNSLELHMISHRDPYMAYQCMECGQSFVVKPSFSTHLLLEHGISDVSDYINKKQCYNKNALEKYQERIDNDKPLKENQCQICREQFNNSEDLQKHFRVHGMAFLMKNTNKF